MTIVQSNSPELRRAREEWLTAWAGNLAVTASVGTFGSQIRSIATQFEHGPRFGAVHVSAGYKHNDALLKALKNAANIVPTVPTDDYTGLPAARLGARCPVVEIGFPEELQSVVTINEVMAMRKRFDLLPHEFVVGETVSGNYAIMQLSEDNRSPHFLTAGTSGSGKSQLSHAMILQIAEGNDVILVDCKGGSAFGVLQHRIPNMIGPVAKDPQDIQNALLFALGIMEWRYKVKFKSGKTNWKKLVIFIDEMNVLTSNKTVDEISARAIYFLTRQGREVGVHVVGTMVRPTLDSFMYPDTRADISGKIALTLDSSATNSVVLPGEEADASKLSKAGDMYAKSAGHSAVRAQGPFTPPSFVQNLPQLYPIKRNDWNFVPPEALAKVNSLDAPGGKGGSVSIEPKEAAVTIISAAMGEGRPKLQQRLEAEGVGAGGSKAGRLLAYGRDILSSLESLGFYVAKGG